MASTDRPAPAARAVASPGTDLLGGLAGGAYGACIGTIPGLIVGDPLTSMTVGAGLGASAGAFLGAVVRLTRRNGGDVEVASDAARAHGRRIEKPSLPEHLP